MAQFRCICGALSLVFERNLIIRFPDGTWVRLCSLGCPEAKNVRQEADRAWEQHRMIAQRGTVGDALVDASYRNWLIRTPLSATAE